MGRRKDTRVTDPIASMLNAATKHDLIAVIYELINEGTSLRRVCIDYLKEKVAIAPETRQGAESNGILSLWYEVEPDLSELDEYGGGDYDTEDEVWATLTELTEKLNETGLIEDDRLELLDDVLSYIRSGNAGMDDPLYGIAYATCKRDEDLKNLAIRFEEIGKRWTIDHARRIYRGIGSGQKYLELRALKMEYGADYYDLASYYWEIGEKQKALTVAHEGMEKATGRMDELRIFLAKRAKESGNREAYLKYDFAQQTNDLTLSSYKEFKRQCNKKEWEEYEPKLIKRLNNKFNLQAVKIFLYRKDFEKALQYFETPLRSTGYFSQYDDFSVAKKLEAKYPDQILSFYKSSIPNLNATASRKTYAQNAIAVARIRRVLLDVMKKPEEWEDYAKEIKINNAKRPAFQLEFAKVIPGWNSLQ